VGAALTAAIGLGLYPDFEALRDIVRVEREFEPQAGNAEVYDVLYGAYRRIYDSLRDLYRDVNQVRFAGSR
jgi:xylulokinase